MWKGYRSAIAGGGTIEYFANGQMARMTSNSSSGNRATLYKDIRAEPGSIITAIFSARIVSGSGETAPFGAIDFPTSGALVDRIDYTNEWREYRLSYTVPFSANPENGDEVIFAFGVFTAQIGVLEITKPRYEVQGTQETIYDKASKYEDWLFIPLQTGWNNYAGDVTAQPRVKKVGNMVTLLGAVSPPAVNSLGGTTVVKFADLPAGYAPPYNAYMVCHGSGRARWLLTVGSNGSINAARYQENGAYVTPNDSAWLTFTITYAV